MKTNVHPYKTLIGLLLITNCSLTFARRPRPEPRPPLGSSSCTDKSKVLIRQSDTENSALGQIFEQMSLNAQKGIEGFYCGSNSKCTLFIPTTERTVSRSLSCDRSGDTVQCGPMSRECGRWINDTRYPRGYLTIANWDERNGILIYPQSIGELNFSKSIFELVKNSKNVVAHKEPNGDVSYLLDDNYFSFYCYERSSSNYFLARCQLSLGPSAIEEGGHVIVLP